MRLASAACLGSGECHCFHCNEVRADERARIVAWLRGPHIGRGTCAWDATVGEMYADLANAIEREEHRK